MKNHKFMRIGFYSPYLKTLGGGEKYIFDIARYFLKNNHQVEIFGAPKTIVELIKFRFDIDLKKATFHSNQDWFRLGSLRRLIILKKYDYFFYVTDGSLFFTTAKNNILIIQSPAHIPQDNFINKIKLFNWQHCFCYSDYVRTYIKKLPIKVFVLPPAITVNYFNDFKKKDKIVSAGRFSKTLHAKKQEILIEAFRELFRRNKQVELILAGGLLPSDFSYFKWLKKIAIGLPVKFCPNASYKELMKEYRQAKIYWHAAGYRADIKLYPERVEHFGITTVEAMAAGCIPLVFPAGGQVEIVDNNKNGFYWQSIKDLVNKTQEILVNYDQYQKIKIEARKKSQRYDTNSFEKKLREYLCCL